MADNRMPPGCAAIILGIIGLWVAYDSFIAEPRKEKKEKQELEQMWSKSTVDFFTDFDCSSFSIKESDHKIEKFFVIESHLNHSCKLTKYTKTHSVFEEAQNIKDFYSRKINQVNTIIWIKSVEGETEGSYTDGSPAKRLTAEINFIDLNTKGIYKTISIPFDGNPRDKITRSSRERKGTNVYFGTKPYDDIFEVIEKEIFN